MIGRPVRIITIPKRKAIIGYRWWDSLEKEGFQSSFMTSHFWHRRDSIKAHRTPRLHGRVGLHAFKQAKRRNEHVYEGLYLGRVKLWGIVVEHEFGYRAMFGQVHGVVRRKPFTRITLPNM